MPETKKISELPSFTIVQSGDILPVVDEFLTQTGKCTAGQIAAIGGGPPGDNTVTTGKLADNSVTAAKCAFTGPDKLFSRTAAGAGSGVEITCTPYARGLLTAADGSAARAYLDALQSTNNPTFTGQVRVARGTASVPSIAPFDETSTGIFFPVGGSLSIAYSQTEVFRLDEDGTILSRYAGESLLRPSYGAAAWATFNGQSLAASTVSISANQREVARRYGLNGTIGDNATTRSYMQSVETARGVTLSFPNTPTFTDAYGKGTNIPAYNKGTESRANYTSPGDNKHWVWNGSNWVETAATPLFWIGTINLTFPTSSSSLLSGRGISSIARTGTGTYTVNFTYPMPDENYTVLSSCGANPAFVRVGTRTTTSVGLVVLRHDNVALDPDVVSVAIFR